MRPGNMTCKRMTIDQPSTAQRFHHLHNTHVLAVLPSTLHSNGVRVYFLEGPIISQVVLKSALIEGWRLNE